MVEAVVRYEPQTDVAEKTQHHAIDEQTLGEIELGYSVNAYEFDEDFAAEMELMRQGDLADEEYAEWIEVLSAATHQKKRDKDSITQASKRDRDEESCFTTVNGRQWQRGNSRNVGSIRIKNGSTPQAANRAMRAAKEKRLIDSGDFIPNYTVASVEKYNNSFSESDVSGDENLLRPKPSPANDFNPKEKFPKPYSRKDARSEARTQIQEGLEEYYNPDQDPNYSVKDGFSGYVDLHAHLSRPRKIKPIGKAPAWVNPDEPKKRRNKQGRVIDESPYVDTLNMSGNNYLKYVGRSAMSSPRRRNL